MAQLNTTPRRTSRAARTMASGVIKFAVPISSSAPQRPQLLSRSSAAIDLLLRPRSTAGARRQAAQNLRHSRDAFADILFGARVGEPEEPFAGRTERRSVDGTDAGVLDQA